MNKEDKDDLVIELEKWENLNVNPFGFGPGTAGWMPSEGMIGLVARLEVMREALAEADILDMDAATVKMRAKMVEILTVIREQIEPVVQEARLEAIRNSIAVPTMRVPKNNKLH